MFSVQKHLSLILIAVVGISLSVGVFMNLREQEQLTRQIRFQELVSEHMVLLEKDFDTILTVLRSLGGLFLASNKVEPHEFELFTRPIVSRQTEIQALEWIPRVPFSKRQTFEDQIRNHGYTDFHISERRDGVLVPVTSVRKDYFPVYYIEPLAGNESALGFDLASSPARLHALEKSRDSGEQIATERISLVQDIGDQFGFLIFHPIYRPGKLISTVSERQQNLIGFALGVFKVKDIVEKSLNLSGNDTNLDIFIFDLSAPPGSQLLYPKGSTATGPGDIPETTCLKTPLNIAQRNWLVVSCQKDTFVGHEEVQLSWAVLLGALLISGLLTAHVASLNIQKEKIELAVLKRTQELRETQDELVKRERLATLGKLISTVSHELRNPLGAINVAAYLLRKSLKNADTRMNDALDRIFRNIARCERIIGEMLDFTRTTAPSVDPIEIEAWLKAFIAEQPLPDGITLKQYYSLGELTLAIDPERIRRALINVIDNACQAMQEIDEDNEKVLSVRIAKSNNRIEIVIEDTGPGIKPEVRKQIFEPLFSTKSYGVGLGMPIIRDIMQQHNGGIDLDSTVGQGTRVCLWFNLPDNPGILPV